MDSTMQLTVAIFVRKRLMNIGVTMQILSQVDKVT